jgi:hypothetical protein
VTVASLGHRPCFLELLFQEHSTQCWGLSQEFCARLVRYHGAAPESQLHVLFGWGSGQSEVIMEWTSAQDEGESYAPWIAVFALRRTWICHVDIGKVFQVYYFFIIVLKALKRWTPFGWLVPSVFRKFEKLLPYLKLLHTNEAQIV